MARLIAGLLRHGDYHQLHDTPSALQPFPLTERGCGQAQQAARQIADYLQQQGLQLHPLLDSSQLLRGWQTARIVADSLTSDEHPLDVESHAVLAERSVGSAANLTLRQIEQVLRDDPRYPDPPQDWKSNSHYCLPLQGAESLMQAGQRVANHIEKQMRGLSVTATSDTLKLFVGHGAAFRHAAYCLGLLAFDEIAKLSMYHARPLFFEFFAHSGRTDGAAKWQHIDGAWKVRKPISDYTD